MKDELTNKLIEWVERLGDIASEQLPDFAQQIVAYQMWNASIWMYAGIGVLCVIGVLFIMFILCLIIDRHGDQEGVEGIIVILILASIIPFSITFTNYSLIKKCEVAPKLVIIDYVRNK